ncbi:MAG: efflux RND transporter periplasmic adaptor subunit [Steroidobacteraceae bacterium]
MSPSKPLRARSVGGIVAIAILVAIVASGIGIRAADQRRLHQWTDEQAIPSVAVVTPVNAESVVHIQLPGRLEAQARAPLYARVSGYLKSWSADIGTHVKAGQVLAVIEAPDLEQQLLQAQADYASAKANAALAASTSKRWQLMLGRNLVSKQEVEEKAGDLAAKEALANAARANVDRLRTLLNFTRITAPFDGIVTARRTDVGALIHEGGGSDSELFVVSDTSRLRVYVDLPQVYVARLTEAASASITVPEHLDKTFPAKVEGFSRAVNAATGTTLVQLSVDNKNGELLPGGFANVSVELPQARPTLQLPASALIFDEEGTRVAIVGANDRVVLKPITIARDNGATIDIATGLEPDDRVIDAPPDGLLSGSAVRVLKPTQATGGAPAAAKS